MMNKNNKDLEYWLAVETRKVKLDREMRHKLNSIEWYVEKSKPSGKKKPQEFLWWTHLVYVFSSKIVFKIAKFSMQV